MRLGQPIKVADGVFQLRVLGARVTVLVEKGTAILVDAGLWGSQGLILDGLRSLGLNREDLRMVVITHAHPDHAGGLKGLVEGSGIPVGVHRNEADVVEGSVPTPSPLRSPRLAKLTQPLLSKLMGGPVSVTDRLEDGDVVPFGTEVRVVHLPGHTEGSIGLHLPRKRMIIVGDALQYKMGRRLSPPAAAVTQDREEAMESLKKLSCMAFDTICFSHFPPMREGGAVALREMLRHGVPGGRLTAKGKLV